MSVRFVLDPETGHVVYPEPFEAPSNVMPNTGTNAPPAGPLQVNPLLAPATISWDVRLPFKSHVERWTQAERAKLAESATIPPTGRLELQSPQLPWRISVRPSTPNVFVTVYDVLSTIQESLEPQITRQEWKLFNYTNKCMILTARGTRVKNYQPGCQADEFYNHPRRVDSLGEFTWFAGLTPAPRQGSVDLGFRRRR